ncbi:MAG: toprim domain-containing protein [Deltaproteobacteria bacterium]|nr:toprim domain-containing protein [Deltaproteobacteria bacterium]
MSIDPQVIEQLKIKTDLSSYIQSRGIPLNKVGHNYKGFCPFHNETTPSFTVNPKDNLWQCFGCGIGGDVFSFVERFDKVGFSKAVQIVAKNQGSSLKEPPQQKEVQSQDSVRQIKLLNHVVKFYQQELVNDKRGLDYLKQRAITDKQSILDFGTGFCAGNLGNILPSDEDTLNQLKQIGLLNKNGHEMFYGCVVFPLTDFDGTVLGLYGRRVEEDQVSHLYLPGPRKGLMNWQAAKRSRNLIFVESIIDALTLYSHGFKNVIPVYGTNGFTNWHVELFKRYPIEQVFICFDNDDAGRSGAFSVRARIKEFKPTGKRVKVDIINLYCKDINEYFCKGHSADDFKDLLKSTSKKIPDEVIQPVKTERFYEITEHGFKISYGQREYEVKGISRQGTQLKATIKASSDLTGERFQITTLDFYSLRSREWFAKVLKDLFNERLEIVFEDLNRILTKIEQYEPPKEKASQIKRMTKAEREEALIFLQKKDLLNEILSDLEFLGFTGEETNKLTAYLVATSRKMEEPLSLLVQSRSAAGKSTLQDAVLNLLPDEDKIKYTRLTDQALFYKDENSLVHKVLAIEEAEGVGGSAYSIRALQSAKELTVATTSKDPATGRLRTEEYRVNGPLSIMMTTTAVDLDHEMETRFLSVSVDETQGMTEKIHNKQRESETLEGYLSKKRIEQARTKHHNAQRLLKPLVVINPYAPQLKFPSDNLRSRRDHKKYLGLIKTVAFLHQYQRPVKSYTQDGNSEKKFEYIEVTLDDIKTANKLASEVLGRSLDELTAPSRTLLGLIQNMVREAVKKQNKKETDLTIKRPFIFNRKMIRDYAKWSDWQVKTHITELEELGYIYSHIGSKGKEYIYELKLTDDKAPTEKIYLDLTDVTNLEGQKPYLVA